jgi:hypothetical protein
MESISDDLWQRNIDMHSWTMGTYPIGSLIWKATDPCCHQSGMEIWYRMASVDEIIQALKGPAHKTRFWLTTYVEITITHSRLSCGWDTSFLSKREPLNNDGHGSFDFIESFSLWHPFHHKNFPFVSVSNFLKSSSGGYMSKWIRGDDSWNWNHCEHQNSGHALAIFISVIDKN